MVTLRRRKLIWWIGSAVVLLAALAVAGPFIYIHFIEGPAPAKLELPMPHASTSAPGTPSSAASSSAMSGTWNVGPGSLAGYRVQEVLVGQNATAVGRTSKIWGSLTIDGTSASKGSFTVDMASVVSDQSQRNAQFDGRIMDVSQYPTATLVLTKSITLGTLPGVGTAKQYAAQGILTMHGVSKPVTFTVTAERVGSEIDVLADLPITFSAWHIANPSIGGFVTTANNGTLEVLLHLTRGVGNTPSTSSGSSSGGGGGGPVTVPSTTVPPLTVPSS
ncbi:MAG TPA: YceI family protein [Acidimicrobiales bacterium]|jgi:polyisoprenoid-binding protein YceI